MAPGNQVDSRDIDFLSFSDEIVSDGDKPMPCNPSTPETAPMGAYLCDANTSICLEKWSVSERYIRGRLPALIWK